MAIRRIGALVLSSTILLAPRAAWAQPAPAFEVASVVENRSGGVTRLSPGLEPSFPGRKPVPVPGQISITNATLREIIGLAYGIEPGLSKYSLVGTRDHLLATRFNIIAQPPKDALPSQTLAMLRALLVERFKLKVHTETRPTDSYLMTLAGRGKLGPRLRSSTQDCTSPSMPKDSNQRARLGPHDANGQALCPAIFYEFGKPTADEWTIRFVSPLRFLIMLVQTFVDRPIVDSTGLMGSFEWAVSFSPAQKTENGAVSIFTAFKEQLGLKLEPGTAMREVVIVDSVEMPAPN
jgi:uncharacterized protein (TIGR03435 family)